MDKIANFGDGQKLGISASALTPFLYREKHNRDLAVDMRSIKKAVDAAQKKKAKTEDIQEAQLSALDIKIILYCAHTMHFEYCRKHKEQLPPDDPFEWLEQFDNVFTIYEIAPELFELWNSSSKTLSKPKKK